MELRMREGSDDAPKPNTDTQRQSGRGCRLGGGGSGGECILSDGALSSVGVSTARTVILSRRPFFHGASFIHRLLLHTSNGDFETAVEQWLLLKCLRRPRRQLGLRRE